MYDYIPIREKAQGIFRALIQFPEDLRGRVLFFEKIWGRKVYNLPKKGVYVAERNREKEPDPVWDVIVHLKDEGVSKSELLRVIEEVFKEDSHA